MWEDTSERGHVRLREVCYEAGILQGLVELGNKRTQRLLRRIATTSPYRRESSKSQMERVQDGYTRGFSFGFATPPSTRWRGLQPTARIFHTSRNSNGVTRQ